MCAKNFINFQISSATVVHSMAAKSINTKRQTVAATSVTPKDKDSPSKRRTVYLIEENVELSTVTEEQALEEIKTSLELAAETDYDPVVTHVFIVLGASVSSDSNLPDLSLFVKVLTTI